MYRFFWLWRVLSDDDDEDEEDEEDDDDGVGDTTLEAGILTDSDAERNVVSVTLLRASWKNVSASACSDDSREHTPALLS